MTADFRALLKAAKLPERTVPVCLRADLVAEHERLDRELVALRRNPPDSLGGDGRGELADRIRELEAEMAAAVYDFRLRALPSAGFRALLAAHPPRKDDVDVVVSDADLGFNPDTFFPAIARACIVDPELDDDTWAELDEKLTHRQFDDLAQAAWRLNCGDVDVPFSRAASTLSPVTDGE